MTSETAANDQLIILGWIESAAEQPAAEEGTGPKGRVDLGEGAGAGRGRECGEGEGGCWRVQGWSGVENLTLLIIYNFEATLIL